MRGMRISKMDAAKTAIFEVMKTIPQSTHVGLIVFGGFDQQSGKWIHELGPRNDTVLFDSLNKIRTGGGTPLGEYMKYGADALLKAREKQYGYGSYRLLVVTDGEASDTVLVDRYTPDIISRGITVDVIGVDMQSDHTLATRANSYRRANDPASLETAIKEVFAEVGSKAGTQTGVSDFSELSTIPDEVIWSIINAMSTSGNHPIGFKSSGKKSSQTVAATPYSSTVSSSGNGANRIWLGILILAAAISLIYKVAQSD